MTSMWIGTSINHYVVFLVQHQQFWHIIFWWGLTITKDFQDSVFACESSLPYTNYSWIACMTNIVIVKPQNIYNLYFLRNFWLEKIGGKNHMLKDPWQYDFYVNINKHKPLSCLPCPTSTILAYNILMGAHNHRRFPR